MDRSIAGPDDNRSGCRDHSDSQTDVDNIQAALGTRCSSRWAAWIGFLTRTLRINRISRGRNTLGRNTARAFARIAIAVGAISVVIVLVIHKSIACSC